MPNLTAQVERASIIGNITDKSGAAMAGVAITVTNETTNSRVSVLTDDAGAYTSVNLIPGSYTINASRSGFRSVVFRESVLQVGQSVRLDIAMEVGSLDQTVEVAVEAVNALPLNGRNFVQLAILAPSVSGLDYVQSGTINTGKRPDEPRPGGTALQANGASDQSRARQQAVSRSVKERPLITDGEAPRVTRIARRE